MKKVNFKSIKNFAIGFIVGISILTTGNAYANTTSLEKVQAYVNYDISVAYNGESVALNNAPITYNDKTYLPLTDVGKITKTNVKWNQKEKRVEMTDQNSKNYKVINNYYNSDESNNDIAIKVDDIIFVPLASGGRHYDIFNEIMFTQKTKTVSFKNSPLEVVANDTISSNVKAFNYQGEIFIKESILEEVSKASHN